MRAALRRMSYAEVIVASKETGVHFQTMWKMRMATSSANPGIDTVRRFGAYLPHLVKPEPPMT